MKDSVIVSAMKDTLVRNPEQLGRSIRLKRLERGLSQKALAERLGLERKWVIRLEAGNGKAEIGLVLKALEALGLRSLLSEAQPSDSGKNKRSPKSRLDEVFRRLQRPEQK